MGRESGKKVEEKVDGKIEADGIRHGKNNSNGMRNPIVIIVTKLPLGEVELEIAPGSARFRNQLSRRKSDIISLIELLRSRRIARFRSLNGQNRELGLSGIIPVS